MKDNEKITVEKQRMWKLYVISIGMILVGICISVILGNRIFETVSEYNEEIQKEVYAFNLMSVQNIGAFLVQSVGNVMITIGIVLHVIVVQQLVRMLGNHYGETNKNWLDKQFKEKRIMLIGILLLTYDICMPSGYLSNARMWIQMEYQVDILQYIFGDYQVSMVAKYVIVPLAVVLLLCAIYNVVTRGKHILFLNVAIAIFAGGVLLDIGIKTVKNEFYLVLTCLVTIILFVVMGRKVVQLKEEA